VGLAQHRLDLLGEAEVLAQVQSIPPVILEPQTKVILAGTAFLTVLEAAAVQARLDQQELLVQARQVDRVFIPALLALMFSAVAVAVADKE
jgi:hypothetical protein